MARLTPAELRSRLAYDFEVMLGLDGPTIESWRGFVSHAAAAAGVEATPAEAAAGLVTLYSVTFAFPMLSHPGARLARATATFDLTAGGNYPSTTPSVQFVSYPRPFCVRVAPASGVVCVGPGWSESGGHMLLAQLVVHVMRLLNFDEPAGGDAGFPNGAYDYWRSTLGGRPLNPGLVYPTLAEETTHEVAPTATVVLAEPTEFRPRRVPSPVVTIAVPNEGMDFRPARCPETLRPALVRL